jgi:cysteinyl-tRNA synthetase
MSKSLNNFFTIKEVLQELHPEVLRYAMISAHYRSHIEYSQEQLALSKAALEKFYLTLRGLLPSTIKPNDSIFEQRFIAAMDDDFNTPEALAVLFDLTKEINKLRSHSLEQASSLGALLQYLGKILGILNSEPEKFLQNLTSNNPDITSAQIEEKIDLRKKARENKNWDLADQIRLELVQLGIVIEDSTTGTTWRKQ